MLSETEEDIDGDIDCEIEPEGEILGEIDGDSEGDSETDTDELTDGEIDGLIELPIPLSNNKYPSSSNNILQPSSCNKCSLPDSDGLGLGEILGEIDWLTEGEADEDTLGLIL